MSNLLSKDDVIKNKKDAIKAVNALLEFYINNGNERHLKKANLMSYWLKDYMSLINFEERFDPTKNIAYKRGNIVKLNFGFNIGSEYGGLHYGVVLDIQNSHNSPVLTVIPLTSIKSDKSVHNNSVMLGNEIYRSLKLKYDTISKSLKEEQMEIDTLLKLFTLLETGPSNEEHMRIANQFKEQYEQKQKHNAEEQTYLDKIGDEIAQMKQGSIALVNQVTTVSKMRIFDPRNLKGVLAGISLSAESMEKINQKVKELYIF